MTVLVVCDEWCLKYNGAYYLTEIGNTLISRYLRVFERVKLAVRTKEISDNSLKSHSLKLTNKQVEIIEIPFFQGPIQFLRKINQVNKAAKQALQDCDRIVFRLPSVTGFVVWKANIRKKIPYATEVVFDCKDAYISSESIIEKAMWLIMHKLQIMACKKAAGVSCVTKQYLQKRYFSIVSNSFSSHYSTIELPDTFFYKNRFISLKCPLRIIHVANQVEFNGRKGHNQLIDAIHKVVNAGYDVNVTFVGADYNHGVKKLSLYVDSLGLSKRVSFAGFLCRDKLREILINSDIAVLPTKAEGLPRVVIEAMALGLPCITTPVSGNPELIDKKYLRGFNDIDGIADAIITFCNSPEEYAEQSSINIRKAKEYSLTVLNPRRDSFYQSLKEYQPI